MSDDNNKNTDLSYSTFLEDHQADPIMITRGPLRYTLPRRVFSWVEDNAVTNCYNCDKSFNIIIRKHHCRFCGKIFCSTCSDFVASIPQELLSDDAKKGTWNEYITSFISAKDNKQKVCGPCKNIIEQIESVKKTIELFIILDLDIKDLKKAGKVCKIWHNASNYILSIFREIQYKIPGCEYSPLEKKLLWNNAVYLTGHNKYILHLLKTMNTSTLSTDGQGEKITMLIKSKRKISCWTTMCARNCKEELTSFNCIDLLSHSFKQLGNNSLLRSIALGFLENPKRCCNRELLCYMPLLVYYLKYNDGAVADFLIKRCMRDVELLTSLYWEINLYPPESHKQQSHVKIFDRFKVLKKDKKYEEIFLNIIEGHSFTSILEMISKSICEEKKSYDDIKDSFQLKTPLTSPININDKITSIQFEKIKIKNSATKPMIVPCNTESGQIVNILYKKEDVRKDQIILNLIYLVDMILKRDENIDLGLITYNVLPIGKNTGIVEIVENCDTLYYIQEKLQCSILNYILEENIDSTVKDIRGKFVKSTAAGCVITYLFGVGDRHLDNVMVTKSGKLFHIDFGYILGCDPVMNDPGIRITNEMIDALGGLSSKLYLYFTELCTRIFNCLRRNMDIFLNILVLLPNISDVKLTEQQIMDLIIRRFIPGEKDLDAELHLVNQLEKQSYVDKVKDWFHYHSKEKTMSSAMNRLSSAVSSLIQSKRVEDKLYNFE